MNSLVSSFSYCSCGVNALQEQVKNLINKKLPHTDIKIQEVKEQIWCTSDFISEPNYDLIKFLGYQIKGTVGNGATFECKKALHQFDIHLEFSGTKLKSQGISTDHTLHLKNAPTCQTCNLVKVPSTPYRLEDRAQLFLGELLNVVYFDIQVLSVNYAEWSTRWLLGVKPFSTLMGILGEDSQPGYFLVCRCGEQEYFLQFDPENDILEIFLQSNQIIRESFVTDWKNNSEILKKSHREAALSELETAFSNYICSVESGGYKNLLIEKGKEEIKNMKIESISQILWKDTNMKAYIDDISKHGKNTLCIPGYRFTFSLNKSQDTKNKIFFLVYTSLSKTRVGSYTANGSLHELTEKSFEELTSLIKQENGSCVIQ